jgi:hypothetical protein
VPLGFITVTKTALKLEGITILIKVSLRILNVARLALKNTLVAVMKLLLVRVTLLLLIIDLLVGDKLVRVSTSTYINVVPLLGPKAMLTIIVVVPSTLVRVVTITRLLELTIKLTTRVILKFTLVVLIKFALVMVTTMPSIISLEVRVIELITSVY